MSRLNDLIKDLCPNGVEFKKFGDIGPICMCKRILKSQTNNVKGIPFYKIGTFGGIANAYITEDLFKEYREKYSYPQIGEVLISAAGTIGRRVIFDGQPAYFQDSNIVWIANDEKKVLNKFLYYYYELQPWQISSGGTISRLYNDSIAKTKVPVPPLEVQREIVRVLDSFTLFIAELTAELTTELTARKKQYEYYSNRLLSFGDKVVWKTLGDIGRVSMCKRIMKSETSSEGDVPFYKIGTFGGIPNAFISKETYEKYKSKYSYPNKGDILISAAGTIGRTVIFDGEPAYFQDSNIVWLANDETQVLNEFLYYWYQTNPWKVSTGGTIARLYNDNIAGAKVPVLPIETQKRIVYALKNFDDVCNNLKAGIQEEIAVRQKQYEYYRDKLLSFKELGA